MSINKILIGGRKAAWNGEMGPATIKEAGGKIKNSGYSSIICGSEGEKLKLTSKGELKSCSTHATFLAKVGCYIVYSANDEDGVRVAIREVIDIKNNIVITALIQNYTDIKNIPSFLRPAALAAIEKSNCLLCKHIHYKKG